MSADSVTVTVRVTPGAARPGVGGGYPLADPLPQGGSQALVVRVAERAVDGQATRAMVRAVAAAFDVPITSVRVSRGATARVKTLVVTGDASAIRSRLHALLALPAPSARSRERSGP